MWLHPHPNDMVIIRAQTLFGVDQDVSYTVPTGRIFVLCALGSNLHPIDSLGTRLTVLKADGVIVMKAGMAGRAGFFNSPWWPTAMYEFCQWARVPDCVTFSAGTELQVRSFFPSGSIAITAGRAHGYLVGA